MSPDPEDVRLQQLQQIPVFALRQPLRELLADEQAGPLVRERFRTVLHRRPRNAARMVQRLTREQITALINACPEISDEQIRTLFEEYRYGTSPSFHIHLFDVGKLAVRPLDELRQGLAKTLLASSARAAPGLPRWRDLTLDGLVQLPDRKEVSEGTYHFLSRLDYIDENQNPLSTYQTLYGFFWLNTTEGYAIIQANNPEVLKALREAIEQQAGIHLSALIITKRLKDKLRFLRPQDLRSGRLHDPAPGEFTFRWMAVADDNLDHPKYKSLERQYPEVRSMRFREVIGDENDPSVPQKETTLTVRCDQGTFSLAGAIPASQFRAWCLEHLTQLIAVLRPPEHPDFELLVESLNLDAKPEMVGLRSNQRPHVRRLLAALLGAKYGSVNYVQPLGISPLDLAAGLGDLVRAQLPLQCPESGCTAQDYVRCPDCRRARFVVRGQDGGWALHCPEHARPLLAGVLPMEFACEFGHRFALDGADAGDVVELLPVSELETAMAELVKYVPGKHEYDAQAETFVVRGDNLWYYAERAKAPATVFVDIDVGTMTGGKIEGAVVGQGAGAQEEHQ